MNCEYKHYTTHSTSTREHTHHIIVRVHVYSMDDVEETTEIIFDVIPAVEDLESELSIKKQ